MEKDRIVSLNSPIIQKNTPIKRLGLSRKRKSGGFNCNQNAKIRACTDSFPACSDRSENDLSKKVEKTEEDCDGKFNSSPINYDEEIESLQKRIIEEEGKLKALQNDKNKMLQLEELIELWRNGCKSAFLYFIELLKERQSEKIDLKPLLTKLGIWEVMTKYFGSDQDMCLMD